MLPTVGTFLLLLIVHNFPMASGQIWRESPFDFLKPAVDFTGAMRISSNGSCIFETYGKAQKYSGENCLELPTQYPNRNITVLVVEGTAITVVPASAFRRLIALELLEIINNKISTISPNAFNGLSKLKVLNLAGNAISSLDAESLAGLKGLEQLILAKNRISSVLSVTPAMSSSVLQSLTYLHLGGNRHLEKLNKDDFIPLSSGKLKTLHLTFCNIRYIHPDAFAPMNMLRNLSLRGNPNLKSPTLKLALTRFQNTALERLDLSHLGFYGFPKDLLAVISKTNIKYVDMSGMNFSSLLVGDFPPMPNLISLTLDGAGVGYVEEGALETLENLHSLSLKENTLDEVPVSVLLSGLQYLDLSGNKHFIKEFTIAPGIFTNVRRLLELNLSYKRIKALHKNIFLGLIHLEKLHLRKCGIETIDDLAFYHVRYLSYIDLSENPLLVYEFHDEGIFFGLELVREFHLSNLQLPLNVNDSFLFRLQSLETLDLSHNFITHLHKRMFSIFTSLTQLDLSYNTIQYWDEKVFLENKELIYLDLSHNDITKVTPTMMEEMNNLKNLSLEYNPLSCTCELVEFLTWILHSNVSFLGYHPMRTTPAYVCKSPEVYNSKALREISLLLPTECSKDHSRRYSGGLLVALAFLLCLTLVTVVIAYIYQANLRRFLKIKDLFSHENFEYDAFVSYNVNDSEWVFTQLVPNLENEANNIKLCVYDRDFVAGRSISECILESIKNSRKVILVISNSFIQSPWCRFETDLAHHTLMDDNRDGLVLIKLEDLDSYRVTPQLNFLLKTRIYIAWSNDAKEQEIFWKKLHRAIEKPKNSKLARRFSLSRII